MQRLASQNARFHGLIGKLNLDADEKKAIVREASAGRVSSSKDLTAAGALVTHYEDVWLPTGCIFTNHGALNSKADFLIGATTFENLGTHNIDQSLVLDQNAIYN